MRQTSFVVRTFFTVLICLVPSLEARAQLFGDAPALPTVMTRAAASAEASAQQPAGPAPTPRHTGIKAMIKDLGGDVLALPSLENLYWAGIGGGLALAA